MASICRSVWLFSRARSVGMSRIEVPVASSLLRSATRSIPNGWRLRPCLGGVESLLPLHSAIASARLKSNIALDSSCWSWLSLDEEESSYQYFLTWVGFFSRFIAMAFMLWLRLFKSMSLSFVSIHRSKLDNRLPLSAYKA